MVKSLPTSPLRILHIEDNVNDAELVHALLQEQWPECNITRVQSDAELATAIRIGSFDLVLSDYSLPHFDGGSALTLVHRHLPSVPFIFVSGTIGEDNAVEALKRGATDYIIKDRLGRLIPAITRALADVAERVRHGEVEAKLREMQQRLQEFAEHSPDVFWFIAPDPERYVYISPAVAGVFGRTPDDFYGTRSGWEAAVHPEDRGRVREVYAACLEGTAAGFQEEYRILRPDGAERWISDTGTVIRDAAGRIAHLSGIARDVTDAHLAAQQIREQADLLNQAHEAIIISSLDHRVIYWNRGAERLIGWNAGEALGQEFVEFIVTPDQLMFAAALAAATSAGEWRGELRVRHKNGRNPIMEMHATVIRDESGRPKAHLTICSDVTEKHELREQFYRAQRLESIGMLAAGIAHDLNNVLAPILMAPQMLRLHTTNPGDLKMLDVLEKSAERGAGLVRQILGFANGLGGEHRPLQVKHLLRDLASFIDQTFPKSIKLDANIPTALWPVLGSATQVHQVLLNLCVNARDAMPQGGVLRLGARNLVLETGEARRLGKTADGAWLVIHVEDTGTGIPGEVLERIWDPFFTTKADKGTGLGLSTVRGIVESHGGFIDLQTALGKGTRFDVYLPASEVPDETIGGDRSADLPRGAGQLVFVVDHEPGVRDIITSALAKFGYRALSAADPVEAVAAVAARGQEIQLIIADQQLPAMEAGMLVSMFRRLNPKIRLLAVSGHSEDEKAYKMGKLPVDGFLEKPFTVEALCTTVHQILTKLVAAERSRVTANPHGIV
ncbi:MAG TPA: PAS domain S-box protein [Opitutaceae bacterium]|nr:PAS domain S-box protein [Opitutaceae bacterium]